MKFDEIYKLFGEKPWFDLDMVLLASGEAAACIHTELYRWRQAGRLIELRRGLFVFAEPWRKAPISPASLAQAIYPPSYLSGAWALGYWGLIPPQAEFSSVSARPARSFENSFGRYTYTCLPRDLLFGTTILSTAFTGAPEEGLKALSLAPRVALPEKAFLDFCFMQGGDWDAERLEGLGIGAGAELDAGNMAGIEAGALDLERLRAMAARAGRPRLIRAAAALTALLAKSGRVSASPAAGQEASP